MNPRRKESAYMYWAKRHIGVKYNLASSGVPNYPIAQLPLALADLEITGDSYYGYQPLQEAIASHRRVPVERVFHTMGTSLANHLAMAALAEPGDEVLIETPTYELLVSTAEYIGLNVRRFERLRTEGYQIDPERLTSLITPRTRLVVLTNLHNPSSALTPKETLVEIGRKAESVGGRVMVDEAYLESAFDVEWTTAAALGDTFISTSSLTKAYGLSGLRCGWVIAAPRLVSAMWRLKDLFDAIPPHTAELLSVIAFTHLPAIASRSKKLLAENHRLLSAFASEHPGLEIHDFGYGTVAFPHLESRRVAKLDDLLATRYETAIAPGSFFEAPDHFRLGCCTEPATLKEGLSRLGKALAQV